MVFVAIGLFRQFKNCKEYKMKWNHKDLKLALPSKKQVGSVLLTSLQSEKKNCLSSSYFLIHQKLKFPESHFFDWKAQMSSRYQKELFQSYSVVWRYLALEISFTEDKFA